MKKGKTRAVRARNGIMYKAEMDIKKAINDDTTVDADYREGKRTNHLNKTELVYKMTDGVSHFSGRFSHFNKA